MELLATYIALIETLLHRMSLSHELAHLWGALALYAVAFSLPITRRLSSLPLILVSAIQILNELVQAVHYGSLRVEDTLADFGWTLTIPIIIYMATTVSSYFSSTGHTHPEPAHG